MASNNNGVKEERRRRIAERGSDRMALITGRINALPPTPPSPNPHIPRHTQSLSVAATYDSNLNGDNVPPRHLRPQSLSSALSADYHEDHTGSAEAKHDSSISFARLKHQTGFRYSNLDNFNFKGEEEEPLLQPSDTPTEVNNEVSEGDASVTSETKNSVTSETKNSVMSETKNSAQETQRPKNPCKRKPTFFSSRELNSCILASETTRALSSLTIALVVVFCYMISESILASRPLYMVLLTDITIVLARLHREKPRVLEETEGEKVEAHGDGHSWGDAVKLLERGLVLYQAIRGVFIDFSIYLVVVVCGISLM